MTAADLEAAIRSGQAPPIVDVRSEEEFREGHIPGAINVPFHSVASRWPVALTARRVVMYCGHGPRARIARALLRLRGAGGVELLDGHMSGWRREGRPEERSR
jgi:rhodanese-related sulfurtransferase